MPEGGEADNPSGSGIRAEKTGTPAQPNHCVFISYGSKDAVVAEALCAALEKDGIACWIAPRNVMPGAFYADAIVQAINACPVLVLVLSESAIHSPHVLREVERASAKTRPIISFRVDLAPLPTSLEYFLSASHWLDASGGPAERAFPKLIESVRGRMAMASHDGAGSGAATTGRTHRQQESEGRTALADPARERPGGAQASARARNALLAVIAVIAIALAYFVADKFWLSKAPPAVQSAPAAPSVATAAVSPAAAISDKSIAVLPFTDLSENKDQGYFSDGLSEELIDLLGKIPGLRVTARTSSFYFKGKQTTLGEIGKALNVAHVLEGSVRKSGRTLRITAELVRVDNDTRMWSDTYDRKMDDIFKVQDEISDAVVKSLKVSLLGADAPRATATSNSDAYVLFLKALSASEDNTRESIAMAIQYCRQALDLDPKFAPAWGLLATLRIADFAGFGIGSVQEARDNAHREVARALEIDPKQANAHATLGSILYLLDWDPAAAQIELNNALALDPGNANALWLAGYVADTRGQFDEALKFLQRSRDGDPLAADVYTQIGNVNYRAGRLREAAAAYLSVLQLYPKIATDHYRLGLVRLAQGDPTAALAEMQRETDPDFHAVGMPLALDALGRKSDADQAITVAENTAAAGAAYQIALIYAHRKDIDRAFAWLDRAYRQHDTGMLWVRADPLLKSLEPDPRFQTILSKMHLSD